MPALSTGAYRRHCRLPAALAAYRARSACRSSSSTSALSSVVATPTVAVVITDPLASSNGSLNAPATPLGEGLPPGRVGQVLHQQRELVAAEPGRGVGLPHDLGQPDARRHQEL